ncbi:hypothetical protein ABIF64_000439 [Bradyrhizobium japonicum]|uniref:hypothetical protein n=1 Tax=Bradyrhizobium japonicum TaxID=375 RepID=UPI0033928F28
MNQIIRPNTGDMIAPVPEDYLQIVFSPARPTLDMIRTLQPCFNWCDKHRDSDGNITARISTQKGFREKNRDGARFLFDLIPDQTEVLNKADSLFHAAEHEPAPVDWIAAAINLMLAGFPNAKTVSEHYVSGIVDAAMDDEEVWQGYAPGFSTPVVVRTIREVKRSCTFVPAHAEFIELLQKHRQWFRSRQWDLLRLSDLRDRAEAILIGLGEVRFEFDDEEPF